MDINKKTLIRELETKTEMNGVPSEVTETVIDALFSILQEHTRHGDTVKIDDVAIPVSGVQKERTGTFTRHGKRTRKHRSGYKSELDHYSSNYVLNELGLIIHNGDYFLSKAALFMRNAVAVLLIVYLIFVITSTFGC